MRVSKWFLACLLAAAAALPARGAIEVHDIYDLQNIEDNLAGDYVLANDIDATSTDPSSPNWNATEWPGSTGFRPIGPDWGTEFTGTFDGRGFAITGLYVNRTAPDEVGLFGILSGGSILNVHLVGANVTGKIVGAVLGAVDVGTVSGCTSTGTVTGVGSSSMPGGLVGENWDGTISRCSSSVVVTSDGDCWSAGGLLGMNWGTVDLCAASGSVTTLAEWVGGLIGDNNTGTVSRCCSSGAAHGVRYVGGLIGETYLGRVENCYARGEGHASANYAGGLIGRSYAAANQVVGCYATGDVECATTYHGGLIGRNAGGGAVLDSFWDMETSGEATSGGGTGKTTAQMQDDATFTDLGTPGLTTPWDFVDNPHDDAAKEDIWKIDSGEYPELAGLTNSPGSNVMRGSIFHSPVFGGKVLP